VSEKVVLTRLACVRALCARVPQIDEQSINFAGQGEEHTCVSCWSCATTRRSAGMDVLSSSLLKRVRVFLSP
jgi:hypothetical protein